MNKKSGDPDSRAGARSLKRPCFLSTEYASPFYYDMKNRLCHAVTEAVLIGVMIPSRVNEGKPRGLMYRIFTCS